MDVGVGVRGVLHFGMRAHATVRYRTVCTVIAIHEKNKNVLGVDVVNGAAYCRHEHEVQEKHSAGAIHHLLVQHVQRMYHI